MSFYRTTLRSHPHYLSQLASLLWSEFGTTYNHQFGFQSVPDLEVYLERLHIDSAFPNVLVHDGTRPVGFCNIVPDDIGNAFKCDEAGPWLANVVVHPTFRCEGVGASMIEKILEDALHLVFLWTHTKELRDYYTRFGFVEIRVVKEYADHAEICIMKKE